MYVCSHLILLNTNAQLTYNSAFSLGNNANDFGYSIAADASGNYYCTGAVTYWMNANPLGTPYYTTNNGGADIYVAKYNPTGIMSWAIDIGGAGDEAALKITLDGGNNVYITGRFQNTVDFDPGTGTVNRTSNGGFDVFVAKYDENGIFQWVNTFGGPLNDQGLDVTTNPVTTNVIITGGYQSLSMDMDPGSAVQTINNNGNASFNTGNCFVASYTEFSGAYQWAFNIGGFGGATGNKVVTDNSGDVYVGGTVSGDSTDFDPGTGSNWIFNTSNHYKVFLAKYNSSNALQWVNGFGGIYGQTANSLAVDNNGGIYQGGYFNSDSMDIDPGPATYYIHNYPNGVQDIYVAKFNSNNGQLNWAFDVGGYYSEVAQDLVLDNSGHFFITGNFGDTVDFDPGPSSHFVYGSPGSDAYMAEYDTAGHFVSVVPIIGNGSDFGIGVCMVAPNKVGVTGFFSTDTIDFDPGPAVHNLYVNGGNTTWTDAFVATYTIGPLAIEENNFFSLMNVYPNPASRLIVVGYQSSQNEKCELKIFDLLGKELFTCYITKQKKEIDVSQFENGIYFIQLTAGNQTIIQKIVIAH